MGGYFRILKQMSQTRNVLEESFETHSVEDVQKMEETTEEEFDIPQDDLKSIGVDIINEIGSGTYAKVYKGVFHEHDPRIDIIGQNVAVKIINRRAAPDSCQRKFLPRELEVLRKLNHKNLIKTIMVHEERLSEKIYIVSELAQTDLLEYLEVKGALRESVVRRLFYNLASGVNYMHTENVAHRDIKCENCLIGFDGVLKLCDLGFARTLDEGELSRTFCGSTVYAAPEVLSASEDYNPYFSDVWSCGIVLYAMFTAQMPFGRDLLNKFVKQGIVELPKFTVDISEPAIKILEEILLFNPEDRLKLRQITERRHLWYLTKINRKNQPNRNTDCDDRPVIRISQSENQPIKINEEKQ